MYLVLIFIEKVTYNTGSRYNIRNTICESAPRSHYSVSPLCFHWGVGRTGEICAFSIFCFFFFFLRTLILHVWWEELRSTSLQSSSIQPVVFAAASVLYDTSPESTHNWPKPSCSSHFQALKALNFEIFILMDMISCSISFPGSDLFHIVQCPLCLPILS